MRSGQWPARLAAGLLAVMLLALPSAPALAGAQQYEPLAASVRAALHEAVSDAAAPTLPISDVSDRTRWLDEMSARLKGRIPDAAYRTELLTSIHYEATRAGLDPQLVLGLIQVESNFRKYAISSSGARGFMQVMPFWLKVLGREDDNLFHLRTNLRYGCTILRHYLDIEKGDLYRALGRYNGSLGKPEYPNLVRTAWERNWAWTPTRLAAGEGPLKSN
ncbi:lytic transglycosylase domain-containing protein [Azoarcus sp. L1K30]|uniref:lytic transglycosylase domain-containing protein n=1 Tax=Azoarcus sp. L1K30 TaxID=2820277 RepID=UPI001B83EF86|nr:lytic transglycosylase domain-containing protein [Azoarcus sp. L1K30]MBR0568544.1 lytic transglycosylase domain-containing protein [Azoarcus sp. L1K30]